MDRFGSRARDRSPKGISFDDRAIGDADSKEAISEEELLEFLAYDLDPTPVDPEFRERLREELWDFVQRGGAARPKDP